ncbi:hypothetical protein [Halobacteriovorax sp. HLS]|uniref:hypothetical protein n=1 Tax=Halobacteriovorax sp. HLS TaxID=2234000 RepID=UPI000FD8F178|nr:hypothetical protein [Halobacteriovorax sp. HLS]
MKNLYLFIGLIALLSVVYFTQEKKHVEKKEKDDIVSRLVVRKEFGRLEEIQTPYNHLVRRGEDIVYFSSDFKVSQEKINEFLKRIANIRSKKKLSAEDIKNPKDFFPEQFPKISFQMEKCRIEFRLGKKLDFSQDFYVEVKTDGVSEYSIAHDITPYEGVIYNQEESHRSDHKYQRVKSLFFLPTGFFMDLKVFSEDFDNSSVKITNIRNKSFSIDFKTKMTEPAPIAGIKVSSNILDYLKRKYESFEAEMYIKDYDKSKLGRKVGSLETSSAVFNIFESYNNDHRYYLKAPNYPGIFLIKSGEQRLFLYNVQNLWDLKPFEVINGELEIKFDNNESMKIGSHQFGLKAMNTLKMMQSPAKYILDEFKDSDFPHPKLQIAFQARNIEFHFTEREIILVDRRSRISYHYERVDKDLISIDPDDYRVEQ